LRALQCDAVWPGWGFASEDPEFVDRLEAAGVVFIGPSSTAMRLLGDKLASKRLAEATGVPLAPWQQVDGDEDLPALADRIGYPLMVKASAGGGGRGIRKVTAEADLLPAVHAAREEVRKVFGQGAARLRRRRPRHRARRA
jgi:biotin carboxylase